MTFEPRPKLTAEADPATVRETTLEADSIRNRRYTERVKPHWEPDRVWPSILAGLAGPLLAALPGVAVGMYLVNQGVVAYPGADAKEIAEDLPNHLFQPVPLLWMIGLSGIVFIFFAAAAASGSKVGNLQKRLGMVDTMPPAKQMFLAIAATLGVQLIGALLALPLGGETPEAVKQMVGAFGEATRAQQLMLIGLGALMPGLGEELYYRGYVLHGLLRRWPPWLAIFVSGLFFAGIHGEVSYVIQIMPVGILLGWLAFRWGSVWPVVVLHMANNVFAFAPLMSPSVREAIMRNETPIWLTVLEVLGLFALVALVIEIVREEWKRT